VMYPRPRGEPGRVFRDNGKRGEGAIMRKLVQFVQDSIGEMKKVVWPSREEVIASTRVVLVSTVLFAIVLGIVDFLLFKGLDLLF
jgi:preprotein translocase subunit SecE